MKAYGLAFLALIIPAIAWSDERAIHQVDSYTLTNVVEYLTNADAPTLCKLASRDYHPASESEWNEWERSRKSFMSIRGDDGTIIKEYEPRPYTQATDDASRVGGYAIIKKSQPLDANRVMLLTSLLSDNDAHRAIDHMCGFVPGYGLQTIVNGRKVEVLISLCCADWWTRIDDRFIHYSSFGNRENEVYDWIKSIFPDADKKPTK